MIYLLWGKDSFNLQLELNKIVAENKDSRQHNLKEVSLSDFISEILTDSFFDNKRLIVSTNFFAQVTKEKKDKDLIEALGKITPDTTIVFVEDNEPKAALKKFLISNAKIIHHDKPQGKDLIEHIKVKTTELGADISPLAAERLASYVGPDYWQLDEELKKLALYKKDDPMDQVIDVADVDELVRSGFEANIFELMDAISQKNTNRAISLLDSFLDSGENEMYILSMIARQFRNIAMAKLENTNEATLAKKAGIHPYVAKKSIMQARNFSAEEIGSIYDRIIKTDFALKSGQNPRQSLQLIILN